MSASARMAPVPEPAIPLSQNAKVIPPRDLFLLPMISIFSVLIILFPAEWISRKLFRPSISSVANCLVLNDPAHGVRGIPNSTCLMKADEGDLVEYKFNSCGHRTALECGVKSPRAYRIVVVGSSVVFGQHVQVGDTFAVRLMPLLSRATGRTIEIYSEGVQWGTPHGVDLRFADALAAQPDLILWPLTPWDIQNVSQTGPSATVGNADPTSTWRKFLALDPEKLRLSYAMQHILYSNQNQYVRSFLLQESKADFLRKHPTKAWQDDLSQFSRYAADVEHKARSAGVPVVFTLLPQHVQAAMLAEGEWPAGFDPYQIGDEVSSIVQAGGATYIDLLHGFSKISNAGKAYLPVDGHPTAQGHAIIAGLLARKLTEGQAPALPANRDVARN